MRNHCPGSDDRPGTDVDTLHYHRTMTNPDVMAYDGMVNPGLIGPVGIGILKRMSTEPVGRVRVFFLAQYSTTANRTETPTDDTSCKWLSLRI